ncbi:hypothetical protein KDL44_14420 [bacterium]|nr:hypothetical protein [bacterium]
MKRIYLVMAAILVSLLAFGCGGGGSQVADPNTPAGGNGDGSSLELTGPSEVLGSKDVSIRDGQLNITSAVPEQELQAVLDKYGYSIDFQNGNSARINIGAGTDPKVAALELKKEYAIASAAPVSILNTQKPVYDLETFRTSSFTPQQPFAGDTATGLFPDGGGGVGFFFFPGQGMAHSANGFEGAWDVAFSDNVIANPVTIAIIDAGFWDYSAVDRPDLDELNSLDAVNSGFVADNGTFTAGLDAAEWELDVNNVPFRDTGDILLGMLASNPLSIGSLFGNIDLDDPADGIQDDEFWNEGVMGCAPFSTFMLIKTGQLNVDTWSFSDNHIAESIDHAVAAGANIILLGMASNGAVSGNISTALQNARDNDVLVIGPAGDVSNSADFTNDIFTDTAVDITVTPFTPASDPNCISVAATGGNRIGNLGGIDVDNDNNPDFNNLGIGYATPWGAPFDQTFGEVAIWSNTGADIAACGMGIGYGYHPYLTGVGDVRIAGYNYAFTTGRFDTAYAAAYVAGAAAISFQALTAANGGTEPSDDDVLQAIMDNTNGIVDLLGLVDNPLTPDPGDGGLLNASAAANAIAGGGVSGPAMSVSIPAAQLVPATLLTTYQLAPTVSGGTGPFDLSIDWGDGSAPVVVNNWANQDPVALTGGWDTLGLKTVIITVTEQGGEMRSGNRTVEIPVFNAITSNLTVMGPIDPGDPGQGEKLFTPAQPIQDAVTYTFSANIANVFNGSVNGTPNNPQFGWDFDGDNVIDKPGTTVEHAFISTGSFTVKFIVTQDVLPDFEVSRIVLVN